MNVVYYSYYIGSTKRPHTEDKKMRIQLTEMQNLQNGFVRSYAALILIGAIALIGAIWVVVQ